MSPEGSLVPGNQLSYDLTFLQGLLCLAMEKRLFMYGLIQSHCGPPLPPNLVQSA